MTTQTPQKTFIPAGWRKTVCAILAERNSNSIRITKAAWERWEVEFPETMKGDLYTIFEETLSKEVVEGERVFGMTPEGEVYKFFFEHEKRKMYGKINLLLPQRQVILILSAHIPEIASGDKL